VKPKTFSKKTMQNKDLFCKKFILNASIKFKIYYHIFFLHNGYWLLRVTNNKFILKSFKKKNPNIMVHDK